MFDFFQSRILENNPSKQCEELSKTGGISMVDSFSVEEISEKLSIKYKKIVLDAYELQNKKRQLQSNEAKEDIKNDSDEGPDIK